MTGAGVVLVRAWYVPAWLLYAFAFALAISTTSDLWHWSQQRAEPAVFLDWVTGATFVLGAAALLHLFLIFPAPGTLYTKLRGKVWLPYAAAFVPMALVPFFGFSGVGSLAAALITLGLLLGTLFALEFSYRHPSTPLARAQLGWIRWGLAVGISATLLHRLAVIVAPRWCQRRSAPSLGQRGSSSRFLWRSPSCGTGSSRSPASSARASPGASWRRFYWPPTLASW